MFAFKCKNTEATISKLIIFCHLVLKPYLFLAAQIVSDRVSERSKGFGFVTFASEDEAHKALEEMNGKVIPCFLFSLIHLNLAIINNSKMTYSKHSQPLNGRVIFVDYAKPRTNYGSGMPIARGPPDSIKDGWSTYAGSSIRWEALAGRIKCVENQIHVSLLYYLILKNNSEAQPRHDKASKIIENISSDFLQPPNSVDGNLINIPNSFKRYIVW